MLQRVTLFLAAIAAFAQTPGQVQIRVAVVEAGTTLGVGDAHVELDWFGPTPDGNAEDGQTGVTDSQGAFQFTGKGTSGRYRFTARKAGYIVAEASFQATAGKVAYEVKLEMARRSMLTGRVEDAETREPVKSLPVEVVRVSNYGPIQEAITTTDEKGVFVVELSGEGPYLVHVRPRAWSGSRGRNAFTEADSLGGDDDYAETYWPGGFDLTGASPMTITPGSAPGSVKDMGTIRVRKTSYYRAHIAFPAEGCTAGTRYKLTVEREVVGQRRPQRELEDGAECGKDFLIVGLRPGSYRATLEPKNVPEAEQLWGSFSFVITNKNAQGTARVRKGADLEITVVAPEGSKESMDGREINARDRFAKLTADGKAKFVNIPLGHFRVGFVSGLPEGWFLQESRYGGKVIPRSMSGFADLDWDGSGPLQLTMDNRPASVEGVIEDASKDAPGGATAVLAPWPPPPGGYDSTLATESVEADASGRFQFEGLPWGEYRLFAVPKAVLWLGRLDPLIADRLAPRGEKVVVPRGGSLRKDVRVIQER